DRVIKGGTGYAIHLVDGKEVFDRDAHKDLPDEIEKCFPDYSIYPQFDFAVSMTSRGCPRGCSFCHVAAKEGRCSVKVADVSDRGHRPSEVVRLARMITACRDNRDRLCQYRETGAMLDLIEGLDLRLLKGVDIEDINHVRLGSLHFAWDNPKDDLEDKFREFA